MANPIGRLTASVISSARPARAAPPRSSLDPRSTSLPAESMSIANPRAENAGKGWDAGAITCSQVFPRIAPAINSPTKTGANGLLPAAKRSEQTGENQQRQGCEHRLLPAPRDSPLPASTGAADRPA